MQHGLNVALMNAVMAARRFDGAQLAAIEPLLNGRIGDAESLGGIADGFESIRITVGRSEDAESAVLYPTLRRECEGWGTLSYVVRRVGDTPRVKSFAEEWRIIMAAELESDPG
jgi:hypothetical protein